MNGPDSYLYGGAMILVGLISAKRGLVGVLRYLTTSRWPSVPGMIESAGVREGHDYNSTYGGRRAVFQVVLRYSYRVGGKTYSNDQAGGGYQYYTSFKAAQRAASRYTWHQTVDVHVSPKDPMQSTVKLGLYRAYWIGLPFSIAMIGVGASLILVHLGIRFPLHMLHAVENKFKTFA